MPSMKPTTGGNILEAEDADYMYSFVENEIQGFTEKGYLATKVGDARHFKRTAKLPI